MVSIITFGCKVNQYETQLIKENIKRNFKDKNFVIINSCCVTKTAEDEVKKKIRKLLKERKKIYLTGCLIEKDKKIGEEFPDIEIVKKDFFIKFKDKIENFDKHTRAFVKIEDGCENFCTYCIIPSVRGPIKSRREKDIIEEIKNLSKNGYKEIVLTGIDLGSYGKDTGETIFSLIEKIERINKVKRIRLSSIELYHINETLIDFLKNIKKFCPHFHIPLQSGSNKILNLMGRKYNFAQYYEKIEMIRNKIENVTFTTDIIVGFPGEKDDDFRKTCSAIEKINFLKIHIFPFSERENTPAKNFPDKIDEKTIEEREKIILKISNISSNRVKKEFIGKKLNVLFEKEKNGYWEGYSENYIPIIVKSDKNLKNKILPVIPKKIIKNALLCDL